MIEAVTQPGTEVRYGWHDRYKIPLDHPAAFRFYLDYLLVPHSRREMIWATLARASSRIGRILLLAEGSSSTSAFQNSPHSHGEDGAPGGLSDAERSWADLLAPRLEECLRRAGIAVHGPLAFLMLDDYRHSVRRQMVFFLFDRESALPRAVAKVATQATQQTVLEHEYAALWTLHQRLDDDLRVTLPRPLGLIHVGATTTLLEGFLPGRSLYCELRNCWRPHHCASEHFRLACRWLVRFHQATRWESVSLNEESVDRYIVQPLNAFQRDCDASAAERDLISHIITLAKELPNEPLPLVARQGDFWARNVIRCGELVGVVDWEQFHWRSTPFEDLFLFATSYGLSYPWKLGRWATPAAAFRATYLEVSWLAQLVRDYLLSYCEAMGISPKLLELFFPVFLAERAWKEREHSGIKIWRTLFQTYAHRDGPACFC
ncbi:MAG TPA: hypothetical protein VNM72_09175 [Blastocatellia bacterium]|nr:hypothetical protein [Blastocatellia bacterium]